MPIYSSFISPDGTFVLQIERICCLLSCLLVIFLFCVFVCLFVFAASTQNTGKAEQTLEGGLSPGRNSIPWPEREGLLPSFTFTCKF